MFAGVVAGGESETDSFIVIATISAEFVGIHEVGVGQYVTV